MAKWKAWQSYDEVPERILQYCYGNKTAVANRDPAYLAFLNQTYNPKPMRERAAEPDGLPCFVCDKKLSPEEAETRLCTPCQKRVEREGSVRVAGGGYVGIASEK